MIGAMAGQACGGTLDMATASESGTTAKITIAGHHQRATVSDVGVAGTFAITAVTANTSTYTIMAAWARVPAGIRPHSTVITGGFTKRSKGTWLPIIRAWCLP